MGAWDCRGKTVHWIAALAQYYLTDCVEQAEPKHRQLSNRKPFAYIGTVLPPQSNSLGLFSP